MTRASRVTLHGGSGVPTRAIAYLREKRVLRAVFAETGTDRRRADQDDRNPNYSTRELHIRSTRRVDQVDQAIRTLSTSLRPSGEGPGKPDPHPHLHNGGRGGRPPKLISPHSRTSKELVSAPDPFYRYLCACAGKGEGQERKRRLDKIT